jgi:hypothetical protein
LIPGAEYVFSFNLFPFIACNPWVYDSALATESDIEKLEHCGYFLGQWVRDFHLVVFFTYTGGVFNQEIVDFHHRDNLGIAPLYLYSQAELG